MASALLDKFVLLARDVLAATLTALGVIHVISGEAVTRAFPAWPAWLPGRPFWAHAAGALMLVCGAMVLLRKQPRRAAAAIGVLLLLSVAGMHLPRAIPSGDFADAWLNVFKWLSMAGGAFVLAAEFPAARPGSGVDRAIDGLAASETWLLGAFMIGAAVLHVRFAPFVAVFIPVWIPWRLFWTYFTAVALMAGGVGLVVRRVARLAALLSGLMLFLFFLLVHVPRTIADPVHNAGWCEMAEALGFAALAVLLAGRADQTARATRASATGSS
jgi:uncharacterized membrane protein